MHFIAPCGETNTFIDPRVEKNRVQHGKNAYLKSVIIALALLGHQTSHLQNKLFSLVVQNTIFSLVAQYTICKMLTRSKNVVSRKTQFTFYILIMDEKVLVLCEK